MEAMTMTTQETSNGGSHWVCGCDRCDHVLQIRGVDNDVDAVNVAITNGWSIAPKSMLCPACASI